MTAQEYYERALKAMAIVQSRVDAHRAIAIKALAEAYQLPISELHLLVIGMTHRDSLIKPPDRELAESQTKVYDSLVKFRPQIIGVEGFVGDNFSPEALHSFHSKLSAQR